MVLTYMTALPLVVSALLAGGFLRVSLRAGLTALAALAAILAIEWALADAGVFRRWDRTPPPVVLLAVGVAILVSSVAFSPLGARLIRTVPLWALVGFQSFRLPLELTMHQAAVDGAMPVQMSYSGWNFDILTGITALAVAGLIVARRAPGWLLLLWNVVGSILLAVIVTIAAVSTPTFAAFGPDRLNMWIADPPYIWLPGILVPAALFGHVLVWRRLLNPMT